MTIDPVGVAPAGTPAPETVARPMPRWLGIVPPLIFIGLVLQVYHPVLFQTREVISAGSTDVQLQFLPWREFGFGQMRQGHLPLWNPYIYGGAPYLGGFQSALLYPPNWLHLLMPVVPAINWIVAFHIMLMGYFTYLWCRFRKKNPEDRVGMLAALLAGVSGMFCGPYILHVYSGHLPHLAVMVWPPLILLAIERLAQGGRWTWALLGATAGGMMVLAGHPQYVYYIAIVFSVYVLLLALQSRWSKQLLISVAVMGVGAGMLSAVQLLPGAQAAGESLRSGGANYQFASMFGLPPENYLTILAPNILGKLDTQPMGSIPTGEEYQGRGYLWEFSLFFGIVAFLMAGVTVASGPGKVSTALVMIVFSLVLAAGVHLSLIYDTLFNFMPGYASFRGTAKFTYPAMLFLLMLSSMGFDAVFRAKVGTGKVAIVGAVLGVMLLLGAWYMYGNAQQPGDDWKNTLQSLYDTGETYIRRPPDVLSEPIAVAQGVARAAAWSLLWTGLTALGAAGLLGAMWLATSKGLVTARRYLGTALLALAVLEMAQFGSATLAFSPAGTYKLPDFWLKPIEARPPEQQDQRVMFALFSISNMAMPLKIYSVWGYDPGVPQRFGQFVWTALCGTDIEHATQNLDFRPDYAPHWPMMAMIRTGIVCQMGNATRPYILQMRGTMERAQLIGDDMVVPRDKVLSLLASDSTDARKFVVLEQQPAIKPSGSASPGRVLSCVSKTTDSIEVEADADAPCILLMTENYSSSWKLTALEAGPQSDYEVLPGDYTDIAIPLAKGHHHLRLDYFPTSFRIGRVVSILSLFALVVLCFVGMRPPRGVATA